ncbi:MAG: RNA polymerase sigma factor [Gammaproteobacteria bacterium]
MPASALDIVTAPSTRNEDPVVEAHLLERIAVGRERAAFDAFYTLYYARLERFIRRMVHGDEDVQEIINDTLYVVWDRASTFNGTSKPSTWVFGIAFRKARASLSRRYAQPPVTDGEVEEAGDGGAWFGQVEADDWLEYALARLSPEHRAVVELVYHQGLHYREIAEILDCPVDTVKTRMFYARARLKDALRRAENADPGRP